MQKSRPILFTADMVKGVREDLKTKTRRIIAPPAEVHEEPGGRAVSVTRPRKFRDEYCRFAPFDCPYGETGDLLYVRETWQEFPRAMFHYKADIGTELDKEFHQAITGGWRSSRFMPKKAARLWLRVKSVQVGRLQEITDSDCLAEGITKTRFYAEAKDRAEKGLALREGSVERSSFADLWDSINKKRGFGWDVNPWIWIVEFEKAERPEEV